MLKPASLYAFSTVMYFWPSFSSQLCYIVNVSEIRTVLSVLVYGTEEQRYFGARMEVVL